jgi:hypothetical protein
LDKALSFGRDANAAAETATFPSLLAALLELLGELGTDEVRLVFACLGGSKSSFKLLLGILLTAAIAAASDTVTF